MVVTWEGSLFYLDFKVVKNRLLHEPVAVLCRGFCFSICPCFEARNSLLAFAFVIN